MADINNIRTDLKKEIEGIWVPFAMGIELKIARARNPKYVELLRNLTESYRKDIRDDKIDPDKFADILLEVRAKTILLDWRNIEEDGITIPYSSEKAMQYFKDPELKDFYSFVILVSESADEYKKDLIKDSEKN